MTKLQRNGSKQPRKYDANPGSFNHNARLLVINSFATLPVKTVTEQTVPKEKISSLSWWCQYYTHDTPGSKPQVVICGLLDYPPEDIVEELKRLRLKPIKVFAVKRAEAANHRDLLYLAYQEKGSVKMNDLRKVRALFKLNC